MTRRKSCLLLLVGTVGLLAAWLALHLTVLGGSSDEPPPHDSDLRLIWRPVPDQENAYPEIIQAEAKLQWSETRNIEEILQGKTKTWDDAVVKDLLAKNRETLDLSTRLTGSRSGTIPRRS